MSTRQSVPISELFRATPATSCLLTIGPLVLAVGQLLNSYVNGVSPVVSLSFALGVLGFAVVALRHHAAEYRLRTLEAEI
ncbi:hypothetical protein [Natronolimnobius baerhuensis]|uniref:Uncharacterized protein n=1 Tax=Natronolimnobius baerhuensis TaxID=253108 RepID=A0A202EC41_9EURY|nr:hypothetical protein [Natronolimnobius baerhuensis]OVE85758.1 hypothetical protein B2G88_02775 [Natronolimnobius baerhuensis]